MSMMAWFLMAFNGFFIIGCQITRFVSLKYESASSLQKMAFLTAIYAFIADITIFHVTFTKIQLLGLIFSLVIYLCQLIYFVREAKIKKLNKGEVIIKV
jgi:drug/metabolite transporter (DMT)-like permease